MKVSLLDFRLLSSFLQVKHLLNVFTIFCFQNLKKSWHPQTMKNIERVWKAEQKHEAERKKIEELQKELKNERAREEMTRYAEESGAIKSVFPHVLKKVILLLLTSHLKLICLFLLTGKETIAWTGCTRVLLVRCPEMSICWVAPSTNKSPISMRSQRAGRQLRRASCPGPFSTPPPPLPASIWPLRSGRTPCSRSGSCVHLCPVTSGVVKTFTNNFTCV